MRQIIMLPILQFVSKLKWRVKTEKNVWTIIRINFHYKITFELTRHWINVMFSLPNYEYIEKCVQMDFISTQPKLTSSSV
jgi:hypothetical protein